MWIVSGTAAKMTIAFSIAGVMVVYGAFRFFYIKNVLNPEVRRNREVGQADPQ